MQSKLIKTQDFSNVRWLVRQNWFWFVGGGAAIVLSLVMAACLARGLVGEQKYPGGGTWWKAHGYEDDRSQWVLHGESTEYYENQRLRARGSWRHGKRVGNWTAWHADGNRWVEGRFEDGQPVGDWTYFAPDGSIIGKRHNGLKVGLWRESDRAQETIGQGEYQEGELHGKWSFHRHDGSLLFDVEYRHGLIHGIVVVDQPQKMTFHYENGQEVPEKRCLQINGKEYRGDDAKFGAVVRATPSPPMEQLRWVPLDGPFDPASKIVKRESWPNGAPKSQVEYAMVSEKETAWHVRHGTATAFYENGEKKATQQYDFGIEHGTFQAWHRAGPASYVIQYCRGLPTGRWRFWHSNGQLEAEGDILPSWECQGWQFWNEKGNPHQVDNIGQWLNVRLHERPDSSGP